jgi:FkbM family methyltransferase
VPATQALSRLIRKILLVAGSELALADKLRYLRDRTIGCSRTNAERGYREYRIGGSVLLLRERSTDRKVFEEIFIEGAYVRHAKGIPRRGPVVLIDLGANIGLSVISLARALQPLAIVAVEPDGGNFAMLQENLRRAGLQERCTAIRAFAGTERGFAELVDSGNGEWGMRMGAPAQAGVPVLPLEEIVDMAGRSGVTATAATVVLKCDIEGAEIHLFRHMEQWEGRVDYMILELHTEFFSAENFRACLAGSRYHWRIEGEIPAGAVLAVIGLERLELKAALDGPQAAGL